MIINGWFDWAVRRLGPAERRIYADNDLSVIIGHSMVARLGTYSVLTDPLRAPTAWHATNAYDGTLYQHYPIEAGLMASSAGNLKGPAFEAEGGFAPFDEPLTAAQVATFLRIIRDMEAYTGMAYRPGTHRKGFTEHSMWGQTACPSGRYQRLYDDIAAGALENTMTPEEIEEMKALRQRRQLAAFAADLGKYPQMQDVYRYAVSKGYL